MKQVSNFAKVLVSVLMVLCVASFFACSKDDEDKKEYPSELVGNWEYEVEGEYVAIMSLKSDGSAKLYAEMGGSLDIYEASWYVQGGYFYLTQDGETQKAKYSVSGSTLTITAIIEGEEYQVEYTKYTGELPEGTRSVKGTAAKSVRSMIRK